MRPEQLKLQFFLCIAILSFYYTFSGDRVLQMKKSATQATVLDRVAAGLALACGLVMLGYAVYGFIGLQNYYIATLFTFFGVLISLAARKDLQLFFGKIDSEKMHWYFGHISKIMGAYTATVTAFCVNMTRYLPDSLSDNASAYIQLLLWMAPALLLGVGAAYYGKRQKEKRNLPVRYGLITGGLRRILVR